MMNSCSALIPFKYLVFSLELSRIFEYNGFDLRFALKPEFVGSECLI
jgi:hypothetical protein